MSEISVQKFFHSLQSTFRRYLFTLNPIAENEPELRDAFLQELQEENAFAREPLLSVVKSYETGESLADLTDGRTQPSIDRRLRKIPSSELEIERPLYTHQIQSIRLAQANENFAVATGTGSGKTECFLLPILDDALRNPGPGVRAIIVYPMNALANDQLDRLRRLLVNLPEITFGRYTGDTPRDMDKVHQRDAAEILKPNEQFTRAEIRSNPPHILLTNFAMLEYLLLRPGDNDIFRHKRLRFVVLDEAHTYSGAQGIEVSLLMRRVTNLYVKQSIQFILTSATLSGPTANAAREIADFSSELTGGSFKSSSVLVGTISNPFEKQDVKRNSLQTYKRIVPDDQKLDEWLNCLDDASPLRTLLASSGLGDAGSTSDADSRPAQLLYNVFKSNKELADLHGICSSTPLTLSDVCNQLWKQSDDDALRVVRWLVAVGAYAARDQSSVPLLAGRYHFFFRGLAGASICIAPSCPDHSEHPNTFWSGFILSERVQCPSCSSYTLPLKTCFQCGMPAVSVHVINQEAWQALRPVNEANQVVLTWYDTLTEEDFQELPEQDQSQYAFLCVNCQSFQVGNQSNCCEKPIVVRLRILHSEDGDLRECPRCGGSARPYPSALRAFASGEEAPTAVLAEAMLRGMPGDDSSKPAEGRRLLAFSDSRQRAAHFAPYLMRTAAESQFLYPLLQAISAADRTYAGAGAPLGEIASEFLKITLRQKFVALRHTTDEGEPFTEIKPVTKLRTADRKTIQDECLISLLQNFTASGRSRMTIPGLGLAVAEVELSQHEKEQLQLRVPQLFARGVSFGEAVVQNLLAVFLLRKAIKFPDGITLRHFSEGPQLATYHISNQSDEQGRRRFRWNAYEAPARSRSIAVRRSFQLGVLTKAMALHRDSDAEVLSSILNALWDVFRDTNILEETDFPNEHQLNHERILIFRKRDWFSCDRCARLTIIPLGELCPSSDCDGRVKPMSDEGLKKRFEGHHWFYRFMHTPALPIIVREHTAQLTNAAGRRYQREFRDKDLNVLSSSTTFEMGVDVGQLKAVFLRNVPPTPANYIQRAGRAGRRREGAAYAVTFARSTPHDQYHYHEPLGIVRGSVPVPKINLANSRLAQRHVNSFLLGSFLRSLPSVGDRTTVAEFFLSDSGTTPPSDKFQKWIEANNSLLLAGIRRIIPAACPLSAEDALLQSAELMSGQQGVAAMLAQKLAGYERQHQELQVALVKASSAQERLSAAQAVNSVEALLGQARKEQLIDFLASEHWLPSYAFPQDVVRLLVRNPNWVERMRLERDGEYGISEYAPGAEVIADGHTFTSAGIDLQYRELEVRAYRVCSGCRRVEMAPTVTAMQPLCECGIRPQGRLAMPRQFVEPPGFTTSWDDRVPEARLYRLKPPPNSEVFLIDGALPAGFSDHNTLRGVTIGYRADGQLFRANPGKKYSQFRICLDCGRSFERATRNNLHRTPWGSRCGGTRIERVDLGFRFKTDTLQLRFDGLHPPPPPITERSFWLSFQTAMVASAAEVLSIPRDDIDATHRSQSSGGFGGELVIYDRVPGGAGYVEAIKERLREILEATLQRVAQCPNPTCDPLGSCYVCLRTYGNQFQWELLRRNAVADWLSQVLSRTTS